MMNLRRFAVSELFLFIGYQIIISSARAAFHSGSNSIRVVCKTWGGGMFASALNPCVQFIFIEIEQLASFIARYGIIRSFNATVE